MKKLIITLIIAIFLTNICLAQDSNYDGPFIVTDFNFDKTYKNSASVDFYCWPSNDINTYCYEETYYKLDDNNYVYTFGDFEEFSFNGTKEITVFAKNGLENTTSRTFILTIEKEEQSNTQNNSSSGSSSGSSRRTNTIINSTNDANQETENDNNIEEIEIIVEDQFEEDIQNNQIVLDENTSVSVEVRDLGPIVSIAGLFTLNGEDLNKYSIYGLLLIIIIVLTVAFVTAGGKRK